MGYVLNKDGVPRTGESVDALLDKIEDLAPATQEKDGMMSAADKAKLDSMVTYIDGTYYND